MIVDSLSNLHLYQSVHPALAWISDYVRTHDLEKIPLGRHVLTEGIALLREDYSTRDPQPGGYEFHKRFADLQIVVKGKEILAVAHEDHASFRETVPYNEGKDVAKGDATGATDVVLQDGMFCLVYPHETHQPKIRVADACAVIKAVFKIAL
jgi:YhcH/YjgK/YiaL family protein